MYGKPDKSSLSTTGASTANVEPFHTAVQCGGEGKKSDCWIKVGSIILIPCFIPGRQRMEHSLTWFHISMCGIKGLSILADFSHFGINGTCFLYSTLDTGLFFKKKPLFHHYRKENQQKRFTTFVWTRELIITQVWNRILIEDRS